MDIPTYNQWQHSFNQDLVTIELYLFCYIFDEEFIKMIKELKNSNDEGNIKLALAILQNYEDKKIKKNLVEAKLNGS